MDSSETLIKRARRSLEVAEQMLINTYPVVDDPKLILAVAGDIYTALSSTMSALIPNRTESDDFTSEFHVFQDLAHGLGFTEEDTQLVREFHSIMAEHRESPVEFPRKDRFIICDDKYNIKALSVADMKNYLFRAKLFVDKAEGL